MPIKDPYRLKGIPHKVMQEILPAADYWPEVLRFYCQTAHPTDPGLPFMASMWSYSLVHGELTGIHQQMAEKYWHDRRMGLPLRYHVTLFNHNREPDYAPLRNNPKYKQG